MIAGLILTAIIPYSTAVALVSLEKCANDLFHDKGAAPKTLTASEMPLRYFSA